jgi:thiol-disulfide isomerase/thioredoxin
MPGFFFGNVSACISRIMETGIIEGSTMSSPPPDALLFIATGCPHCATVLQGLSELVKQGLIGKLTVVDVAEHPELAAKYGVRAAPWLRLGPFTLTGAHSLAELRLWTEWASGEEGTAHYVGHLLKQGGYMQAAAFIDADTQRLKPLLAIVADPGAKLEVRLGVSALLEAHANSPSLQNLLPQLAELTRHADHRVRADACHLLGLTGSTAARTHVEACLNDANEEVREIAEEAMEKLKTKHAKT